MPRRCSVKKLFESIQNKDKELTLAGVKKAFEKAAGPRRKSLTYKQMKTACGKYDGNITAKKPIGGRCKKSIECTSSNCYLGKCAPYRNDYKDIDDTDD